MAAMAHKYVYWKNFQGAIPHKYVCHQDFNLRNDTIHIAMKENY